ncbi:MAG: zincin-like metallopeptidase domain-containing protein [Firmicutes bacterium]|nr:zincin-like metallopeptidase domain-containing protein [Bacillota bacterium]
MTYKERVEQERQAIADLLVAKIESEPLEWSKGWRSLGEAPVNAKTGKVYNGANFFALILKADKMGYDDPRWLTFNQAKDIGAKVKAGEKATTIFHYTEYDKKTKSAPDWKAINALPPFESLEYQKENITFSLSYHSVFNAAQVDNLAERKLDAMSDEQRIREQNHRIEGVVANSPAPISHGSNRAYYRPGDDAIRLPNISNFNSMQDYYATALHEIAHSTGHSTRLNRFDGKEDTATYAKEELRAEVASMFIQAELGIKLEGSHFENHSAYVQSWLSAVKNDKNVLFDAIKDAGQISNYVNEHCASKFEKTNDDDIIFQAQKETRKRGAEYARSACKIIEHKSTGDIKADMKLAEELFDEIGEQSSYCFRRLDESSPRNEIHEFLYYNSAENEVVRFMGELRRKGVEQGSEATIPHQKASDKPREQGRVASGLESKLQRTPVNYIDKLNLDRLRAIEANVPAELKEQARWCPNIMRSKKDKETGEKKEGEYSKRMVNINYDPAVDKDNWARSDNPATWTTFEEALDYALDNRCAGLTFTLNGSGYSVVDLDKCIGAEGAESTTATSISKALEGTYGEKSMSGTGLHFVVKDNMLGGRHSGKTKEVEVLEQGFISFTGNMISKNNNLTAYPPEFKTSMLAEIGKKAPEVEKPRQNLSTSSYSPTNSDIIARIQRSKKGSEFDRLMAGEDICGDLSRSDFKLLNILAYFTNSDKHAMSDIFRQSGLYRPKKGEAYVDYSIKQAIATLSSQPTKAPNYNNSQSNNPNQYKF